MMLKRKVLMLAMACLIVLSGLLRSIDVQILMQGFVALLMLAMIEDKSRACPLRGLKFLENYFGPACLLGNAWVFGLGAGFGAVLVPLRTPDW